MTPELWKAIFIAEQAVNESWRNNRLGEETVKAFSQFIQKSARQVTKSSMSIFVCYAPFLLFQTNCRFLLTQSAYPEHIDSIFELSENDVVR